MGSEMMTKRMKALADPTRLHIVEFLSQMCCGRAAIDEQGGVEGPTAGEVCCHITGAEKITSTISHHLHELEAADIIKIERKGKQMICSLRPEILKQLAEQLTQIAQPTDQEGCC